VHVRSKRSILTFLSGELSTAMIVGVSVVATPLLLRWLGDERYGAFEAAVDWFGYVALLELGIDGALRPLLARASAGGTKNERGRLIAGGIEAYSMLAGLMVVAGIGLTLMMPRLLSVSTSAVKDLRFGCLVGVAGLLTIPLSPFRALLEAEQKGYFINAALLGQSLIITVCSLLFAWARWGIKGQFAAVFFGTCAFSVFIGRAGVRALGSRWCQHFRGVRQSLEWSMIWNLNRPTLTFNVCRQVGQLTDNIIVAALISPAMVVPFLITQRLAALAQRELQGIGNASWVALAELHAQRQMDIFNDRMVELTRLVAILSIGGLVPIIVYNRHFVTLWVGARCYGGDALTVVAGVNAFLLAIFSLWGWSIGGTGQVAEVVPGTIVQTVINLALSLILTFMFGTIGPVLGTLAGFLTVSSWYLPRLLRRLFDTSVSALIRAALLPLISGVPFGIMLWWLSNAFPPVGWIEMASEMSFSAGFYLASWWLMGLTSVERQLWRQRAYSLAPKIVYQP
jgi:O-antigen/teichoic acid export membrane protein